MPSHKTKFFSGLHIFANCTWWWGPFPKQTWPKAVTHVVRFSCQPFLARRTRSSQKLILHISWVEILHLRICHYENLTSQHMCVCRISIACNHTITSSYWSKIIHLSIQMNWITWISEILNFRSFLTFMTHPVANPCHLVTSAVWHCID